MTDNLSMHLPLKPVERLFPFAVRSRIVVPGRAAMACQQRKLLFVLITTDLSAKSRDQIQRDFNPLPIVERYTSAEIEGFFHFRGAKVLGFLRSALAQALLKEMKAFRLAPAPSVLPAPPAPTVEAPTPESVPPPAATTVPVVPLGWRARRRLQKDERIVEQTRGKLQPSVP